MNLVEIRDLDGPNFFLLEPAIKIEFRFRENEPDPRWFDRFLANLPLSLPEDQISSVDLFGTTVAAAIRYLHAIANLPIPTIIWEKLETPGHIAVVFSWSHRRAALKLAEAIAELVADSPIDITRTTAQIQQLATIAEPNDSPLLVRDRDRTIPIIGITGTNGKTTTTRLIAHIYQTSGFHVGWSSSSGVYIDGQQVLAGDYTGPSGARRVLAEPTIDVAILETARGGILLRGVAYESNDIGVVTNISPDHLDLQGIHSLEGLLRVKSTVVRVTRTSGYVVLNGDDELVRSLAEQVQAPIFFISQHEPTGEIQKHIQSGGHALFVSNKSIIYAHDQKESVLAEIQTIPITIDGKAKHMVENALCAAAACLGGGLSELQVRQGLVSFSNDPEHNAGRLNIFEVDGVSIIVDYAHNEAGLANLLSLARELAAQDACVVSIIGTAGDRTDQSLRAIGRLAADKSDQVIIKHTARYLRGRSNNDELIQCYLAGISSSGRHVPWSIQKSELSAVETALMATHPGDVIAMMCIEQASEVIEFLRAKTHTVNTN